MMTAQKISGPQSFKAREVSRSPSTLNHTIQYRMDRTARPIDAHHHFANQGPTHRSTIARSSWVNPSWFTSSWFTGTRPPTLSGFDASRPRTTLSYTCLPPPASRQTNVPPATPPSVGSGSTSQRRRRQLEVIQQVFNWWKVESQPPEALSYPSNPTESSPPHPLPPSKGSASRRSPDDPRGAASQARPAKSLVHRRGPSASSFLVPDLGRGAPPHGSPVH